MTRPDGRTSPSKTPSPPAQFTFVNQHEDVRSVLDRRIHNEAHRHEIRSHVMRGVRQHEQTLGKKRPTGRPPARARSSEGTYTNPRRPFHRDNALAAFKLDSSSKERLSRAQDLAITRTRSQPTPPPPSLYLSPSNHFLDPFATMHDSNLSHANTDALIQYCISHFIPMSFPTEKQASEREARFALMLHLQRHSHAAFLGCLATIAVHRAVLYRRHDDLSPSDRVHAELIHDPDYRIVLKGAFQATREMQNRGELNGEFLEACFGLISAQTIVGDFPQSLALQQYVQQVLQTVTVPKGSEAWLPLADIKAAVAILSKPAKALPWTKAPVPHNVLLRIRPVSNSQYARIGSAFSYATRLTPQLRQLLADAAIVCQFCEFNASQPEGLDTHEHIMYRCKTHELEYDTVSYVHDIFPYSEDDSQTLLVPALEQVTRLALLGMLSAIAAAVHPATGLGRALTYHQTNALDAYGARLNPDMDPAELKLLVWALFVYAACACAQVEGPKFEHTLAQSCAWLGLRGWAEVEGVLLEYLYVPGVQGVVWRGIWQRAEREAARWGFHQTVAMR